MRLKNDSSHPDDASARSPKGRGDAASALVSALVYVSPNESCRKLEIAAPRRVARHLREPIDHPLSQFARVPTTYFVQGDPTSGLLRTIQEHRRLLPPLSQVCAAPKHVLFGAVVPQGYSSRSEQVRRHVVVYAVLDTGAVCLDDIAGGFDVRSHTLPTDDASAMAMWPRLVSDAAARLIERSASAALAKLRRGYPIAAAPLPAVERLGWLSAAAKSAIIDIEEQRLGFETKMRGAALQQAHGVALTTDPAMLCFSANRLAAADVAVAHLSGETRRKRQQDLRMRRFDQHKACPPLTTLFDHIARATPAVDGGAQPPALHRSLIDIDIGKSPYAVIRDLTGLDKAKQKRLATLGVDGIKRLNVDGLDGGLQAIDFYIRVVAALPQHRVPSTAAEHDALLSTLSNVGSLYDANEVIDMVVGDGAEHEKRAATLGHSRSLLDAVCDFQTRIITPLLELERRRFALTGFLQPQFRRKVALEVLRAGGLKGLARFQERWHRDLPTIEAADAAGRRHSQNDSWRPLIGEMDLGEGWTARELSSQRALKAEGQELHHCVGGYASTVKSGRSLIFSLSHQQGDRSTCEFTCLNGRPRLHQNLTHKNRRPTKQASAAGRRLLQAIIDQEPAQLSLYLSALDRISHSQDVKRDDLERLFVAYAGALTAALGKLRSIGAETSLATFTSHRVQEAVAKTRAQVAPATPQPKAARRRTPTASRARPTAR